MPLHWIQMHTHILRCLKKCVVQRSIWLAFLSNTAAGCTAEQVFRWQHGGEHAAGKLVHCHHSAAAPTYHCISMIILPIHAVNQRCHARLVALAILGHFCLQPINLHSDQPQDNSRTLIDVYNHSIQKMQHSSQHHAQRTLCTHQSHSHRAVLLGLTTPWVADGTVWVRPPTRSHGSEPDRGVEQCGPEGHAEQC